MESTSERNTATLMQISAFTQYIIPLGNFIFPVIIWSLKKKDSAFVDYNGKQAINFQLSLFMYSLLLMIIAVPALLYTIFNDMAFRNQDHCQWVVEEFSAGKITNIVLIAVVAAFLFILLKVAEFILILYAAVKNSNGENYNYPLTINFIK